MAFGPPGIQSDDHFMNKGGSICSGLRQNYESYTSEIVSIFQSTPHSFQKISSTRELLYLKKLFEIFIIFEQEKISYQNYE